MAILFLSIPSYAEASKEVTQGSYQSHIALSVPSPTTPLNTPRSIESVSLDKHEQYIIMRESGGNVRAKNPTSTAFGLGQLLLGNRKHYAPLCDTTHTTIEYDEQLCLFRKYVKDRYKTSEKAAAHSRRMGWY